MRYQSPQRRYWRWFCLLVVLGTLVAVPSCSQPTTANKA
jgi:hypothetical protein